MKMTPLGSLIFPQIVEYSPWFNRGDLIYDKSKHTLTYLNGYYVCSQKQKGKCNISDEKNIKATEFEKNFTEFAKDLLLYEEEAKEIFYSMDKQGLEIIKKDIFREQQILDRMQINIKAIERDYKDKKKINYIDIADFKKLFYEELKISYVRFLLIELEDKLKILGNPKFNTSLGVDMSTTVEKIYLSNNGVIQKIKFEGLIDYLFQFLKSKIPGYYQNSRISIIESENFKSLDLKYVFNKFKQDNFRNTLSYFMYGTKYSEDKQIEQLFKNMEGAAPRQIIKTLYFAKSLSRTSWAHLELKFFSKNHNDKVFGRLQALKSKKGKKIEITMMPAFKKNK